MVRATVNISILGWSLMSEINFVLHIMDSVGKLFRQSASQNFVYRKHATHHAIIYTFFLAECQEHGQVHKVTQDED